MFLVYLTFKACEVMIKMVLLMLLAAFAACVFSVQLVGLMFNPKGTARAMRETSKSFGRAFRRLL